MDSLLSSPDRDKMAKQTMEALKKAYNGQVEPLDMAAELWAARQQNLELRRQIDEISQLKEKDRLHIAALNSRVGKIKDLSLDQTTLMGQVDVAVWLAREVGLERFLNPEFKRILQNQGLNCQKIDKSFKLEKPTGRNTRGDRETRYEKNQLLHEDLDSIVARRSKEVKVQLFPILQ